MPGQCFLDGHYRPGTDLATDVLLWLYFDLFLKLDTICFRCLKREGIAAGSKGYRGIGVNGE